MQFIKSAKCKLYKTNRGKEKVYKYDLKSLVVIACLHLVGRLFHVLAPR